MKKILFENILSEKEISFLQSLIGKDLCGIGSDSISIYPSQPELWKFHIWIELSNWNDNLVQRLEYSYDETYAGDDFIKLRIEAHNRERRALNADITFAGIDMFSIEKIEIYGYDSEYQVENYFMDIEIANLKKGELYEEKMIIENAILFYGKNGKRIWVECFHSILEINVTMNEDYIEKRLGFNQIEFNAKMKLKKLLK